MFTENVKVRKFLIALLTVFMVCLLSLTGMQIYQAYAVDAEWYKSENWSWLGGWSENSIVTSDTDAKTVTGKNKNAGEFGFGMFKQGISIHNSEIKFKVNQRTLDNSLGTNGNIKLIFTNKGAWYLDSQTAFTLDFAHISGEANKASVSQNIKYVGGGPQISYAKSAGADPVFYWDGSQENVLKMYFENGILNFELNGTKFDSTPVSLDTARLTELGILDYFVNGEGYLSVWSQNNDLCEITFTSIADEEPEYSSNLPEGFISCQDTKAFQSLMNGVGRINMKSSDGQDYFIKKTSPYNLNNLLVKLSLGLEDGGKYGVFIDNVADNKLNKQIRIYFERISASSAKITVATYDGIKESVIGEDEVNVAFTDSKGSDFGKTIELQLKKLTINYQLYCNGEIVEIDLSSISNFISENYVNTEGYLLFSNPASNDSAVSVYWAKNPVSGAAGSEWKKEAGEEVQMVLDGGKFQVYSLSESGAFKVRNDRDKIWVDGFGLKFNLDKIDKNNSEEFRIILSSSKDNWYTESNVFGIVLGFSLSEGKTTINIGTKENPGVGTAETEDCYWDYAKPNVVYLGQDNGYWVLSVNDYILNIVGNDFQNTLNAYLDNFIGKTAYLQMENLGGRATSVTLQEICYGIPTAAAPRGWVQGVIAGPQWLSSAQQGQIAFTSPGQGYTLQNTMENVVVNGFKMTLKMAPGSSDSNMTMAFNNGGHEWYSDTDSFGIYISWTTGMGYDKAQIGLVYSNPADGKSSELVYNQSVAFKWFDENTFEIKKYQGQYKILLNGTELFVGQKDYKDRDFNALMSDTIDKYTDNQAIFQIFVGGGNATTVIQEISTVKRNSPPTQIAGEVTNLESHEYTLNEKISLDLNTIFKDNDGDQMTFVADLGEVKGNIWEFVPDKTGDISVTFIANDGKSDSAPITVTFKVVEENGASLGLIVGLSVGGLVVVAAIIGVIIYLKKRNIHKGE